MKVMRGRLWLILGIFGLIALAACSVTRPRPPAPVIVWPSATPASGRSVGGLPGGATPVRGFYASSGMPAEQIPPTRSPGDPLTGNHSMGADCITILGNGGDQGYTQGVWENEVSYNWAIPDGCLSAVAAQTVTLTSGVVVSQPLMMFWPPTYMDYGARWTDSAGSHDPAGTGDNPYGRLHLPAWMTAAGTYSFTYTSWYGTLYQGPTFNGAFKTAMLQIIADGGARYSSNPQLVAIRVNAGLAGETLPCCANNCGNGESFQAVAGGMVGTVSCTDYVQYIKDITEALYTAFPNQLILVQSCTSPCTNYTSKSLVRDLMTDWAASGMTRIGIGHNCVQPDRPDADEIDGNVFADWRTFSAGPTVNGLGLPVAFEDSNAYDASTPKQQLIYWQALLAAGASGDIYSFMTPRLTAGEINAYAWEVNDYWFGSDTRAWIIFRAREYPTQDYAPGYGDSGYIGDFTKYLTVLNQWVAPQVCAPVVKLTAVAANAAAGSRIVAAGTACPGNLPTPVSTALAMDASFNRQARALAAGSTLFLAADTGWPYYAQTRVITVTVAYLNIGTDTFVVSYPNSLEDSVSYTVTKTNTGLWARATFTGTSLISNAFTDWGSGEYFISIYNPSGVDYLHELFVDAALAGTPLATPTPTLTPGPYLSPTPTPPVTATTVPSSTPTWTVTPMPSPTPPYWWTNNEGTPPGKWSYDPPALTLTPEYGATVVAVSTYTSPVQGYRVEGVWSNDDWRHGGVLHPFVAVTVTQGIIAGSVNVHSYDSGGGQDQFSLLKLGAGVNKNGVYTEYPWLDIFLMPDGSSGYGTSGSGVYLRGEGTYVYTKIYTGTIATGAWHEISVAWTLNGLGATSYITTTWDSGTPTVYSWVQDATYWVQKLTALYVGSYYAYIAHAPSITLDDFWAVEGALTTPTPAPTPTPVAQAAWPELACPTLTVTVDGALTEWAVVVPYTLTLATAAYSWPITPTVPATLTGVFRCAHSGALLYLSGVITDTTVVSPTGSLENGDAARVVLDGLADGDFRHLLDDHDLLIGSNGAVRDFEVYPIGATVAVSPTAGGWQWEMSLPLATLEASTAVGEIIGLTFGYHDSEGGTTWAHVLTGTKRAGRLE